MIPNIQSYFGPPPGALVTCARFDTLFFQQYFFACGINATSFFDLAYFFLNSTQSKLDEVMFLSLFPGFTFCSYLIIKSVRKIITNLDLVRVETVEGFSILKTVFEEDNLEIV